jgi:hypothetical protein
MIAFATLLRRGLVEAIINLANHNVGGNITLKNVVEMRECTLITFEYTNAYREVGGDAATVIPAFEVIIRPATSQE